MPGSMEEGKNTGREQIKQFLDVFKTAKAELTYQPPFRTSRQGNTVVFEYEDGGTMLNRPYHNRLAASFDVCSDIAVYREYWSVLDPQLSQAHELMSEPSTK